MKRGRLVLTRGKGEGFMVGDATIIVQDLSKGRARFIILAPEAMAVVRLELVDEPR